MFLRCQSHKFITDEKLNCRTTEDSAHGGAKLAGGDLRRAALGVLECDTGAGSVGASVSVLGCEGRRPKPRVHARPRQRADGNRSNRGRTRRNRSQSRKGRGGNGRGAHVGEVGVVVRARRRPEARNRGGELRRSRGRRGRGRRTRRSMLQLLTLRG